MVSVSPSSDFPLPHAPRSDTRPAVRAGLAALVLLVGVFGLWAATARIQGAVILHGQAVVPGLPKKVQSLEGGVIATIAVRDGDHVAAGDLLLTFDGTLAQANLDTARSRLAEALTLRARLEAESLGLSAPDFTARPDPVPLPFPAAEIAARRDSQRRLFEIRAAGRADRAAQLTESLALLETGIAGAEEQIAALTAQRSSLEADLARLEGLSEQGLTRRSEVTTLERQRAEIDVRIAALATERRELATRMRQSRIEASQAETTFREAVDTELREVSAKIDELVLQIATLEASLSRIALHAPTAGVVHEMQVAMPGEVVGPGDTVLQIVPQGSGVEFELRLDPAAVEDVRIGQAARIRIAALGPGGADDLPAVVSSVSPDTLVDQRSGTRYYRVGLKVPPRELAALGARGPLPGMPVEAFLETEAHSVLSYLVEPISSHLRHAMRD